MPQNEEQLIALSSMSLGQKALIAAFSIDTKEGERIQKMGVVSGEQLEIVGFSPQNDSIEIKICGYFLSLRKQDADHIKVKLLP
jgi:Fe2+ transport system protein FeoA